MEGNYSSPNKDIFLNTRSTTESGLVGGDNMSTMILWGELFIEAQSFNSNTNILYQYNKSTILLEKNVKIFQARGIEWLKIIIYLWVIILKRGMFWLNNV